MSRIAPIALAAAAITSHVPFCQFASRRGLGGSAFHFDPAGTTAPPSNQTTQQAAAPDYAALRAEFGRLQTEGQQLVDLATRESRDLTDDEKKANNTRFSRMTQIKTTLDERERFATLAISGNPAPGTPANATVTNPTNPPGRETFNGDGSGVIVVGDDKGVDKAEFGRAFNRWAATGQMDQKFATIVTTTASSILLPKSVLTPLVTGSMNTLREAYAAWGVSPMSTPGDTSTFNQPILDPTAGGLVAENASSETENAPSMSESIVSTVKTYQSGSVWYSNLALAATSFDLLSATVPHLELNKELGLEAAIIAAIIADAGITQSVATATTTTFTYANSVQLANKLPKRYQMLKVRLLSAAAYAYAEGLVDDNNRPVMVADPQNQRLVRMHGTPTFRCDYLEALAASKTVGLEISLAGFHLRDAGQGVARYTQSPARPNQTGLNLFGYHAYGYAPSAVATLETPAS